MCRNKAETLKGAAEARNEPSDCTPEQGGCKQSVFRRLPGLGVCPQNQLAPPAIPDTVSQTVRVVIDAKTVDYLRQRASGAKLEDFDRLLAMVPDAEPEEHDRIPAKS